MLFEIAAVVSIGRAAVARTIWGWLRLDTDWKSVFWALLVVAVIIGFDVTVPP
jgi:hypothetical protein